MNIWLDHRRGATLLMAFLFAGSLAGLLLFPALPVHKDIATPTAVPTLLALATPTVREASTPTAEPPTPSPLPTPTPTATPLPPSPTPTSTAPISPPTPTEPAPASNPGESSPTPTATPLPPSPPSGCSTLMCQLLHRLADLSALPEPTDAIILQRSSQDTTNLEHYWDYFNSDEWFVARGFQIRTGYDGQKEYVILPRTEGPGYISRLYFTHREHDWNLKEGEDPKSPEATEWGFFHEVGNIRFYFDDEATPRLDMPATEFFRGDVWPFMTPLVRHYGTGNGGNISYIPIPFSRSVVVATTGRPNLMEIEVVQFTKDPGGVESFRPNLSPSEANELKRAITLWKDRGAYPYYQRSGLKSEKQTLTIAPFSSAQVEVPGPGVITSLRLRLASGQDEGLNMKIYWDGEPTPSLEGPIRNLFGTAEEMKYYRSLPLGIFWDGSANLFYNYFPMPFNSQARIVFDNGRGDPAQMEVEILYQPAPFQERIARFHAAFERERLQARKDDGGNYVLADLQGSGRYVGCIITMYDLDRRPVDAFPAPEWHFAYLESDVNIWVDGRYALPGTGIEGDFDAGYYYKYTGAPGREWIFPLTGNTWKDYQNWGEVTSQYRFYLTNKVEFRDSLRVEVEHGFKGNNLAVTYSSTAFWYQDE